MNTGLKYSVKSMRNTHKVDVNFLYVMHANISINMLEKDMFIV